MKSVLELEMPELDFGDPAVAADPQGAARELAADAWIARTPSGYALLRWADCKALARDKRFRTPEGLNLSANGITEGVAFDWASGTVLGLDGADHDRIRRLAQPGFTPQRLEELRPVARDLFAGLLDETLPGGRGEAADLCMSYSVRMICRLLGWPEDDWRKILSWADAANEVASVAVGPEELRRIEAALLEMRAYTSSHLEELRRAPGDGFAAAIVGFEEEGDRLTTNEVLSLFETLLVAGSDTTKAVLTTAMYLFAIRPEQWEQLVAGPELIPSAVEEVLRFRAPTFATGRVAREDVVFNEVEFPAGTYVNVVHTAANFDPAEYEAPLDFDVARYARGQKVPKPTHLSFGFGAHVCIGNFLARMELQEAFGLLVERVGAFRLDESDPRGVEWASPFSIYSPTHLPLEWDPA